MKLIVMIHRWGSYYVVGARAILAIIWYGVQCKLALLSVFL